MAENESLDLRGKASRRWRYLRDMISKGASADQVGTMIVRNLALAIRQIVRNKQFDLPRVLDAGSNGSTSPADLMREVRGHEYGQLFAQHAQQGLARDELTQSVLENARDRFLDQIRHELVGSPRFPTINAFESARKGWQSSAHGGIHRLAREVSENPTRAPSVPRESAQDKSIRQESLLNTSLLR